MITSKAFWVALAERALKTFAQGFLGALTLAGVLNLFTADWRVYLAVAVTDAVYSILTSLMSIIPIVPMAPPSTPVAPAPVPDPGPMTQPLYPDSYADRGQHEVHDA
jgi:hypothetical protein